MERRALVLDANILIRAVLGQRVRRILEAHADNVSFFIPETAYAEVEEHLARLVAKHGVDPTKTLAFLKIHSRARDSGRFGPLKRFRNRSAEAA
jgi:predicted nucleic acid-binding protein